MNQKCKLRVCSCKGTGGNKTRCMSVFNTHKTNFCWSNFVDKESDGKFSSRSIMNVSPFLSSK